MNNKTIFLRNMALCLMFFFSGLCGLLYETVWLRLAFANFGVITPVVSVIISIFMAGLGLGSWIAGKYIWNWKHKCRLSAITLYGFTELLIGTGAIAVPWLFQHSTTFLLTAGDINGGTYLFYSGLAICLSILPWTFAMGATYPIVLEFLQEFKDKDAQQFGRLYAANTAGAVVGTLITVFLLIEIFGFQRTLLVAAAINFLIGMVAILWGVKHQQTQGERIFEPAQNEPVDSTSFNKNDVGQRRISFGLLILFTTGFCSMAMEVVWVRAFTPILGSLVYSFAILLSIYLLCTWFGAFLYRFNVSRRKPKAINQFLVLMAITSCLPLLATNVDLAQFFDKHVLENHLDCLPFILTSVSLFSMCLGYLTPSIIDAMTKSEPAAVGRAYAINILGCILGPLVSGYVLLPMFSARSSLIFLSLPLLALILIGCLNQKEQIQISKMAAFSTLTIMILISLSSLCFGTWEEGDFVKLVKPGQKAIYRDYAATTIALGEGLHQYLMINGCNVTKKSTVTKFMAHLPLVFLNKTPKSLLIICFGMGTTFRSALSWDIKVTGVELLPSVRNAFSYFHSDAQQVISNPNGRIVIDDGGRFLKRTREKFDVITIDPPPPIGAAASSLLYSTEFYQLIKEHLTPGGILQEWYCPITSKPILKAVARSMVQSFPYVRVFKPIKDKLDDAPGYHFFASDQPIAVPNLKNFITRMPTAAKVDLQEWFKSAKSVQVMENKIAEVLSGEVPFNSILSSDSALIITDDHPFNEYFFLRSITGRQIYWRDRPSFFVIP